MSKNNKFTILRPAQPSKPPSATSSPSISTSPANAPLSSEFYLSKQNTIHLNQKSILIKFPENSSLYFYGKVLAKCIKGKISIYGYELTPNKDAIACYSPFCLPSLYFESKENNEDGDTSDLEGFNERELKFIKETNESVLLLISIEDGLDNLTGSFSNIFKPLQPLNATIPNFYTNLQQDLPRYKMPVYNLNFNPDKVNKFMVYGVKGSGKSTFTKYLVNHLLSSFDKICYLDLDMGQAEFTPSGLLSLSLIQSPLIGPSFTHLLTPQTPSTESSSNFIVKSKFYGHLSPESDPSKYKSQVESLYNFYTQNIAKYRIPLVVNTHGWVKNLGYDLLSYFIDLIQPDLFQTVPSLSLSTNSGSRFGSVLERISKKSEELYISGSIRVPVNLSFCKVQAKEQRILNLQCYFSQIYSSCSGTELYHYDLSPINSKLPIAIGINNVKVEIMGSEDLCNDDYLMVLNGSLCALVNIDDDCVGLCVVRSILPPSKCISHDKTTNEANTSDGFYYIISSLNAIQLNELKVSKLVKGYVGLPAELMFQIKSSKSNCRGGPYGDLYHSESVIVSHSIRRVRRNVIRGGGK